MEGDDVEETEMEKHLNALRSGLNQLPEMVAFTFVGVTVDGETVLLGAPDLEACSACLGFGKAVINNQPGGKA